MAEQNDKKRDRSPSFSSEEEHDSYQNEFRSSLSDVKKLRKDLLENLDDFELCSTNPALDSFMKSFEEEISPVTVTESITGGSAADLGFLLEASDDELGLPPSTASPVHLGDDEVAELVNDFSDSAGEDGLGELWGFDEHIIGFEFGVGLTETENIDAVGSEYVAIDGLFDYSDMGFGSADFVC